MKSWNDNRLKRMYERIQNQAIERGFDKTRLESPYLTKLSKETKSKRILHMIEEAYYLGMLKGISYVDEMKTPICLRDMEVNPIEDINYSVLVDIKRKGNVLMLYFEDTAANKVFEKEIHLDFDVFIIDYHNLTYSIEEVKENKYPMFYVNDTIKKEMMFPGDSDLIAHKNTERFYYGDKYTKVINILLTMKFELKEFPEDKKIIDFEKHGNQIKFYLGDLDCNDYWGDDWDDYPYESNAGIVSNKFIKGEFIISLPYHYNVYEPADNFENREYSKENMKDGSIPCIVYTEIDTIFGFLSAIALKDSKRIYFNDTRRQL